MDSMRLTHLALSENGFLFDTSTGFTYTLNKTGAFILKLLIEGKSHERIVEALVARFEIHVDAARWDIDRFVMRLQELGALTSAASTTDASVSM